MNLKKADRRFVKIKTLSFYCVSMDISGCVIELNKSNPDLKRNQLIEF